MDDYLLSHRVIESHAHLRKREMVLSLLRLLIPRLSEEIAWEHNIKADEIDCQIMPFGSYGLGAHLADSDMDLVFLGAAHVRRRDFFLFFPDLLKDQATIEDVEVVADAKVPIIRCTVDSIPVDISFVRLKIAAIPHDINLLDNALLEGLDEGCLRSLDGPRTMQFIMQQVRDTDIPTFRLAIQAVKYWARQRDIYDKQMGYLNGMAWTLLLLKTYMTYQQQSPGASVTVMELLLSFFNMWANWPWTAPVILTDLIPSYSGTRIEYRSLTQFENAVMPIVTPCYPVKNAAPAVTKSTLKALSNELIRAHLVLSSQQSQDKMLPKLFKPLNLLTGYKHFIKIIVNADTCSTHESWLIKMPSLIPRFTECLESTPELREIRPYSKILVRSPIHYNTREQKLAIQHCEPSKELPDDKVSKLEPGLLHRSCYLICLKVVSAGPDERYTLDLSSQITQFRRVIDSQRGGKKESDLVVNIISGKRKDVAQLLHEHAL
ncbi:hypothetical protein O0I10_009923 [Lichtheimia ornata]|uniref:polynucleotide adenylyltransferase n=1 Tax=Lichtheimia ornata TaxID=688661 RepID=A0AAD7UW50_9FUNG|nr:uncharacterized protein O0I10_009923 [Lichtheimia ornata]KAJ8654355.1 hypothetical protein O0I10_009923 [Lichtheimia ornata]